MIRFILVDLLNAYLICAAALSVYLYINNSDDVDKPAGWKFIVTFWAVPILWVSVEIYSWHRRWKLKRLLRKKGLKIQQNLKKGGIDVTFEVYDIKHPDEQNSR